MKSRMTLLLLALAAAAPALLSPELERRLGAARPEEKLSVCVVLRAQCAPAEVTAGTGGLAPSERRALVASRLRQFAAAEQVSLLSRLAELGAEGVAPLWILNAVGCQLSADAIREVAARGDVWFVEQDLQHAPGLERATGPATDEVAWGVRKIRAPEVWAQGNTGQNVVVAVIGTGVNYNHPDLADHMWTDVRYPLHGWDFENHDPDPMDSTGHGTFTAGVVASDGHEGSQCGVAPDAQVMALRVRTMADSISEMQCWQAIEFAVVPPGRDRAGANIYVLPLGWLLSWNPQQAAWRQTVLATNAAGLVQMTSSGSERGTPPPNACRVPGTVPPPWWNPDNTGTGALAGMMTVGAVDSSDVITSFSSPGPVTWQTVPPYNDYPYPPGLTKPDVCAPGVNIKSLALGGGYTQMSGVSWATAHTGGAAALMLSRDSTLSPAAVDSILELTAVDRGPTGKDNDYGAGRIDALAAVNYIGSAVQEATEPSRSGPVPATVGRRLASVPAGASVYDATGRPVRGSAPAAPGVYFVRAAGNATQRVVITR